MIAFVTLLLGLISGLYPIEVTVSGPVAKVEFLLDGAVAAATATPPWKSYVDLGDGLEPHELVARSLDATGAEIARAVQWINLPRAPAEVEIVLENGEDGKPRGARLTWQSVNSVAPGAITLTFDGTLLALDSDRRVALPKFDSKQPHILSAEVWFGPGVIGRRDVAFGGSYGEEISNSLTAIPLRVNRSQGRGQAPVSPSSLRGRLTANGQPLQVVAVEQGPAKVIVINVPGPGRVFDRFFWSHGRVELGSDRGAILTVPAALAGMRTEMRFGDDDVVRLIAPTSKRYEGSGVAAELFDISRDFGAKDGGLLWLLARTALDDGNRTLPRIADAVAVAGLQAAVENRRRAVILVLSDGEGDASRYLPETVRHYLAAIRVPLYVWSLYGPKVPTGERWGGAEDVSTIQRLYRAFDRVKRDLDSQRIVWVEGLHLPQSVSLTPGASSIQQVGPSAAAPPRDSR